jgi:3-oxoadipate enol-lactonase
MAMIDILMPKLGMTMTAGTVVRWLKQSGDTVTAGEPICEVETDKLNSELEAEVSGVLTVLAEEGEELGVGATLGQIAASEGAERKIPAATGAPAAGGLETITANGIKLAVQRIGTGTPLVLIHGLASSMGLWAWLDQSQLEGVQIISYDLRGHGASERPVGAHTLAKHMADLVGLLATLGINKATFAGFSLGGMIAIELAASHPELVASLALLDTTATFPQATRDMFFEMASRASFNGMAAIADTFIERTFSPQYLQTNPKVVATVRKGILTSDASSIAAATRMVAKVELSARLSQISCPTLVLVGANDQLTPPELSEALTTGIHGAQLQLIADSGHVTPVEQPVAVTTALANLIKSSPS